MHRIGDKYPCKLLLNICIGVELRASSAVASNYKTRNASSIIIQSLRIYDLKEMPDASVYSRIKAEMHDYEIIFGFVTVVGLFFIALFLMVGVLLMEIKTYRIVSF